MTKSKCCGAEIQCVEQDDPEGNVYQRCPKCGENNPDPAPRSCDEEDRLEMAKGVWQTHAYRLKPYEYTAFAINRGIELERERIAELVREMGSEAFNRHMSFDHIDRIEAAKWETCQRILAIVEGGK